jgi:hypothetical protein
MSKGRDVGMRAGTLSTAVLFLISDHPNSNSQNAIRNCGCHFLGLRSIDGQSEHQAGLLVIGDFSPTTVSITLIHHHSVGMPLRNQNPCVVALERPNQIEELPNPEHGIHGLVIINEPDTWLVNLMTKAAKHQVDHGRHSTAGYRFLFSARM